MAEDESEGQTPAFAQAQEPGSEGTEEVWEASPAAQAAGAAPPAEGKPRPSEEEIEVALVLMGVHLRTEELTCRDIDQRLGWPIGYASKVLRGELPCSKTRGLQMRAAMGIDEEEFQAHMREMEARRAAAPKPLIRSPHKRRAKNPRPPRGRRREMEPEDDPLPTLPPEVLRGLKQLEAKLTADLIRKGKLKPLPPT